MADWRSRITTEAGKRSGQPTIRGMRIGVADVMQMLASGMTHEEILNDFDELVAEDIHACVHYAANLTAMTRELPPTTSDPAGR